MIQRRQICIYMPQITASDAAPARVYLGLIHTSWTITDFRYFISGTCAAGTTAPTALELRRYYNGTTVDIVLAGFGTPSTTIALTGYLERGAGEDEEDHDPHFAYGSDKLMYAYWDHYIILDPAAAAGVVNVSLAVHLNLERTI